MQVRFVGSESQRRLLELGVSVAQLSTCCATSPQGARKWLVGDSKPDAAKRKRIEKQWPDATSRGWEMAPEQPARPERLEPVRSASRRAPIPEPAEQADDAEPQTAKEAAQVHLASVQRMIDEARADRRTGDEIKLRELERRAVRDMAAFTGELSSADEAKLTQSATWKKLRRAILDALGPFPAACKSVAAALEVLGA